MTTQYLLDGRVKTWNGERGYGFIRTAQGDVFALSSAFPKGVRVAIGSKVSVQCHDTPRGLRAEMVTLQ